MKEDQEAIRVMAFELWEKSPVPKLDAEHYWYLAEALMKPVEPPVPTVPPEPVVPPVPVPAEANSAWEPVEPLKPGSPEGQQ
jgi:hypothetical protein